MDVKYAVLQFVNRVRRAPADGSDPRLLGRLEALALAAFDGALVALHAPIADRTWEVRGMLLSAQAGPGSRIPIQFPEPIEIVGMNPIVVTTGAGPLLHATPDDIDVAIDVNQASYQTSGEGVTSPANANPTGQFISLSHLSIQTPRLWMWRLNAARPEVGFTLRWKRGANVYEPAMVCIGIYGRRTGATQGAQ
jgi:hypothetical protein